MYTKNLGLVGLAPELPLPPSNGLPFKINNYQDVDEPRFDPEIHLNLEMPEFVRIFPNFDSVDRTPPFTLDQNGSKFAYSAPFQVSSKKIKFVLRYTHYEL